MVKPQTAVLPKKLFAAIHAEQPKPGISPSVVAVARMEPDEALKCLGSRREGLTDEESVERLARNGHNVLDRDKQVGWPKLLFHSVINPLVVLLAILTAISFATGDFRAGSMMLIMIVMGVGLKLFQEVRADHAAAKLKAMISVRANVLRMGQLIEVNVSQLVPGDVVSLASGDMVPADVRFLTTKDLFVTQSALSGESLPVEKSVMETKADSKLPTDFTSLGFLGTSVESGTATAVVVSTGKNTMLGGMAEAISVQTEKTAFEHGIAKFTWLMLRFVLVMVPLVFLINGFARGNWWDAFFFSIAVAVGLTPEMLPMIVTVCLSKGAMVMSRQKVIVKRLDAIQNLGAMDILCTDKTGTLTVDRVILERYCDVKLQDDPGVLILAYLNSHFQTGLKNVLDRAILSHTETHTHAKIPDYEKIDEIPFDFQRRVMSVVVRGPDNVDRLISKGAPEAIFERCKTFELDNVEFPMDHSHIDQLKCEYEKLSSDGFRVLAIASKTMAGGSVIESHPRAYSKEDEKDLVLNGYVAFLDPPKDTAAKAIELLNHHGVSVKVVTGDNDKVARKICQQVGLPTEAVLLGDDLDGMCDEKLQVEALKATLFARVSPLHKQRIVRALKGCGHTVGFMGDGINDAAALRTADVGISVDTAADIAKESADLILLEKSLLVLESGVVEGRKVFANILKYVRMGASSNFGNMFSVIGASIFVPFIPMAPIQILANNLLYDIGQTAIPTDAVDEELIEKPKPWDLDKLTRFILLVGPCSSLFDYITFLVMLYGFGCWDVATSESLASSKSLFQTGWFIESLLTQTLVIHVIRTNRIPFLQSLCSWQLAVASSVIIAIGVWLPFSQLRYELGFRELPWSYWSFLAFVLVAYLALTQAVKVWLLRKNWI